MQTEKLSNAILNAWDMLIELPLPGFAKRKRAHIHDDSLLTQLSFITIAVILGTAACLLAHVLKTFFAPVAGSFLFAIIVLAFNEAKDRGHGMGMLVNAIEGYFAKEPFNSILGTLNNELKLSANPWINLIFPLALLLKFAALFFLFYFNAVYFLFVVLTVAFGLQAVWAAEVSSLGTEPILNIPKDQNKYIWIYGAIILLFVFVYAPIAVILSALVALFLGTVALNYCIKTFGGVDSAQITLVSYLSEFCTLLIGLLLLSSR